MSILALLLALIGQAIALVCRLNIFLRNEIPRATGALGLQLG